jgi:hypothetical protein
VADAVLTRLDQSDQGTFGRIVAGSLSLLTGELAWRDNQPNVSCLPEPGLHRVVWTWSPRFRRFMYLLLGTEPRAGIRIHSANFCGDDTLGYRRQLNGCLAFGERLGWIDRQKALLLSAPAVRRFEQFMKGRPFTLEIRQ